MLPFMCISLLILNFILFLFSGDFWLDNEDVVWLMSWLAWLLIHVFHELVIISWLVSSFSKSILYIVCHVPMYFDFPFKLWITHTLVWPLELILLSPMYLMSKFILNLSSFVDGEACIYAGFRFAIALTAIVVVNICLMLNLISSVASLLETTRISSLFVKLGLVALWKWFVTNIHRGISTCISIAACFLWTLYYTLRSVLLPTPTCCFLSSVPFISKPEAVHPKGGILAAFTTYGLSNVMTTSWEYKCSMIQSISQCLLCNFIRAFIGVYRFCLYD